MTFQTLQKIVKENNIPEDVHLLSGSGCEDDNTEMDGVYYNKSKNEIVFTQYPFGYDNYYWNPNDWKCLGAIKKN